MRLVVLVFGLVCCLAFGSRVSAETEDLAHAGPWDAFGGTDTGGHEVCGMSTSWDDGRSFLIKRYEGDSYLTAQIYDPAWRLEEGHVAVAFQMDDNTPWSANPSVEKGSKWIEFTIPTLRLPDFFKEFVDSQTLYLRMGDNNVRWKMDLSGTETVIQAFKSCLNTM